MLHTTFQLLKLAGACGQRSGSDKGYDKLARAMGGVSLYGKNTPIPLTRIVESNGLTDALWCLHAVLSEESGQRDILLRLFACDCAEHVAHFYGPLTSTGWQPLDTIEVARRYARGEATTKELAAAEAAAEANADVVSTEAAAWYAAEAAAEAAGDVASTGNITWNAAAAAWTAAQTARTAAQTAGNAAGAAWAARAARAAAWDAGNIASTLSTTGNITWNAARDAAAAAWIAAQTAGAAAEATERQWQTERLLDYLEGRAN